MDNDQYVVDRLAEVENKLTFLIDTIRDSQGDFSYIINELGNINKLKLIAAPVESNIGKYYIELIKYDEDSIEDNKFYREPLRNDTGNVMVWSLEEEAYEILNTLRNHFLNNGCSGAIVVHID